MDGKHALSDEWQQVVEHGILFLKTEFEYHGPKNFQSLSAPFKRIWCRLLGISVPELISPVWPLDTVVQLEAARHWGWSSSVGYKSPI